MTHKCICCGFEIKRIYEEETTLDTDGMWLDGVVGQISAGYGSNYDMDKIIIALCDSCIKDKSEKLEIKILSWFSGKNK